MSCRYRSARFSVHLRRCRCTIVGVGEVAEVVEGAKTFCLSRMFWARRKVRGPEVPGRTEGPGGAGISGAHESAKRGNLGIVDLAEKLQGKPKSEGEKENLGWMEEWES